MQVSVIEYGMGNVQSVLNACARLGAAPSVASDGDILATQAPTHIILPGVGAIGNSLANLRARGFETLIDRLVRQEGVPMLGICVGMQMLAETCEEFGEHRGLGWIPGTVRRLSDDGRGLKVPHVGWNEAELARADPLFEGVEAAHFYFVHSNAMECPEEYVLARSDYGRKFVCAVRIGNVAGIQFHPEKSSAAGETLLGNFLGV